MFHVQFAVSRLQKVWSVAAMASLSLGFYAAFRGDANIAVTCLVLGLMMSVMARGPNSRVSGE